MSDYPAAWQRFMRISLWLLGGLFIVAVLAVALLRLAYPYELEWMEGGTLLTVQRLAAGNQIYVPPSVDFVPFIYTPLYFYLGSGLVSLFGGGFTPLRLLSLAASLGSLTMIFLLVRNRTRDIFWSFIGAAFFAACFEIGGGWLDLARNDALYLFFLLLAVFLWERSRGGFVGHLLAGLAFVLAFLTKQSALLVLVPILDFYPERSFDCGKARVVPLTREFFDSWQADGALPYEYAAGSESFSQANSLIESDGRKWRKLAVM